MSVVTKLAVQAENRTKKLLESLDSMTKSWNYASKYENLAKLAELSLELSQFTNKSTDELFKILSSVPRDQLKEEINRLIYSTGPPNRHKALPK